MNRQGGARKQTPTKRQKKVAARKPPVAIESPLPEAVELSAESTGYVAKLAAALAEVSAAQDKWVQEIEVASQSPALLQDIACQARLSSAMSSVVVAASQLRIEPVPDRMQAVNEVLGRARAQAELAAAGKRDGSGVLSTAAIVASIQHLDEMSRLLQEAYGLVRG